MSNVKDLTGQKFGNLEVVSLHKTGLHGREYLCKCDCGKEKVYRGSTLTSGKVIGCGCMQGKQNKGRTYDEVAKSRVGERHNSLVIIDIERGKRGYLMVCKCDCGNVVKRVYSDIKNNRVKSCGCKSSLEIESNTISYSNYKWNFIKDGEKINMRSGYEVMYAIILENKGVAWEYRPKSFVLEEKRYTPSFYLPDVDKWIDVRGKIDKTLKEKINSFRRDGYKIDLIGKNFLQTELAYSYYKMRKKNELVHTPIIIKRKKENV